ncbi:di-trans,poly-cis-decaprenylcistransferase [Patescibacteria group bacterium]|nr:di-trans,poly-cis-decaprenylcistransferase [Patescibacteria group bacterium]
MKIPNHLGIIIDGNRRWAKKKGLPSFYGHKKGLDNVKKILDHCLDRGVKILTLYAFSSENWNRTKKEIEYLMKLFGETLNNKNIKDLNERNVRLRVIGQKEKLPQILQDLIMKAEKETKNNKKGIINLAISYGGRPEIVQAVRSIIEKKIPANKVTEDTINNNLWTSGMPYPDLIIRTGGEHRLSNFLTWQSAYSEFYFLKKFWPEFTEKDIDKAFQEYNTRHRRFGK